MRPVGAVGSQFAACTRPGRSGSAAGPSTLKELRRFGDLLGKRGGPKGRFFKV